MGGLGKHYSHSEGHVVTGHCMLTGLYMLLGQRCPLQVHMYRSRTVCERENEPSRSKIDMAVNEIECFEPVRDTYTHVLIDSWYHCKRLRKAAMVPVLERIHKLSTIFQLLPRLSGKLV